MNKISQEKLTEYRAKTFRLSPSRKLKSLQDAVDFVKLRGFVFFWPIKGINFPSLWTAVAGNRPVADAHDDPGHISWTWKDESLGKKIWYYGKIIRKKSTMIDLRMAPYFYALSNNYGKPAEDILIQYQEGKITREEKAVFDLIHAQGPLDTIAIRRGTHLTSKESNSRFERAMTKLQADFKILPVGISDSGGWRYAFIYDLVNRYYPDIPRKARYIHEKTAQETLVTTYFSSIGAVEIREVIKFFQWEKTQVIRTVNRLAKEGKLIKDVIHPAQTGEWIAIPEILNS
jgi:hypothetical protein